MVEPKRKSRKAKDKTAEIPKALEGAEDTTLTPLSDVREAPFEVPRTSSCSSKPTDELPGQGVASAMPIAQANQASLEELGQLKKAFEDLSQRVTGEKISQSAVSDDALKVDWQAKMVSFSERDARMSRQVRFLSFVTLGSFLLSAVSLLLSQTARQSAIMTQLQLGQMESYQRLVSSRPSAVIASSTESVREPHSFSHARKAVSLPRARPHKPSRHRTPSQAVIEIPFRPLSK